MIPLLEDKEDMAMNISWTEEMLLIVLKLEDAKDELEGGPQGEGEGDIEYDDYSCCCRCSHHTGLTHEASSLPRSEDEASTTERYDPFIY